MIAWVSVVQDRACGFDNLKRGWGGGGCGCTVIDSDDDLCVKLPKSQILSATTSEIHSLGHSYFTYDMAPRFKPFAMFF